MAKLWPTSKFTKNEPILALRGAGKWSNLVILFLFALLLKACSHPEVLYSVVGAPGQTSATELDEPGYQFRIPRSLIALKAAEGGKMLHDTVIDPLPTTGWVALPENSSLVYSLTLSEPEGGSVPVEQFEAIIKTGNHRFFPIAACRSGLLSIGGIDPDPGTVTEIRKAKVQIIPTELAMPVSVGTPARGYSALYRAAGVSTLGSTTALEITYFPDTSLVKSIGSTVTNNVQATLKSISALVTAVGGIGVFAPPLGPVPTTTPGEIATFPVTVSDNRFIRSIPIPYKGTITPHTVCGADVTETGRPSSTEAIDNLTAAITAAEGAYKNWGKKQQ